MPEGELRIPEAVEAATLLQFTGGVTAFLYEPRMYGFSLVGMVYKDRKDRFRSGRLIRTSDITELLDEHGYLIALTISGSRYVLVDPNGQFMTRGSVK